MNAPSPSPQSTEARPQPPDDRSLLYSVADGALHAVMLGCCESYLGAFAVELGHGPRALALLATVPLLLGALSQLSSAWLIALFGGRKRLVVSGAVLQALSILGFITVATTEQHHLLPLLLTKVLFWVSGSVIAPAWGDWIGGLTEGVSRTDYFGRRSALVNAALMVSFVSTGLLMHAATAHRLTAFAAVFAVALLARLASAWALTQHRELQQAEASEPLWQRAVYLLRVGHWRVPMYLAAMYLGAHIAVPFFTPYMLRELGMSYLVYTLLSTTSVFTKVVTFALAHRVAKRLSLKAMLGLAGAGVAAVPLAWSLSPQIAWLVGVHVLSGASWAALEYTSFQLLLDGAPARVRSEFLAFANSLSGLMQLSGAWIGGLLLDSHALRYTEIFQLSALLRAIPLLLLVISLPRWVRPTHWARLVFTRLIYVRPSAGAGQRPILTDERDSSQPDEP